MPDWLLSDNDVKARIVKKGLLNQFNGPFYKYTIIIWECNNVSR
ncbi:hypothetical protein SynMITS9220_00174 [Synechococcus sp. MIT S9220]|nr:hypothetical protein SynMITS9220_00174 [Synechococcus sp. MIT S9220]